MMSSSQVPERRLLSKPLRRTTEDTEATDAERERTQRNSFQKKKIHRGLRCLAALGDGSLGRGLRRCRWGRLRGKHRDRQSEHSGGGGETAKHFHKDPPQFVRLRPPLPFGLRRGFGETGSAFARLRERLRRAGMARWLAYPSCVPPRRSLRYD